MATTTTLASPFFDSLKTVKYSNLSESSITFLISSNLHSPTAEFKIVHDCPICQSFVAEICFFMVGEVLCALAFGVGIFLGPTKARNRVKFWWKDPQIWWLKTTETDSAILDRTFCCRILYKDQCLVGICTAHRNSIFWSPIYIV